MAKEIKMMDIMFSDPNNTFNAGCNVEGRVYLQVLQEFKLKSIKVHLQGVSRVTWNESKSYTKGSSSKTSHNNVGVVFDAVAIIKGAPCTLQPGRYHWSFSESIPAFCPGTFEDQWGGVRYVAKLNIERSLGKSDVNMVKNFIIRGVLDLNHEDDAKCEVMKEGSTTTGLFCCKSGHIDGKIYLPKKGYVAPEQLPFTVDVCNLSRGKCSIKVILSQQAVFRADGQSKRTSQPLKGISYKKPVVSGESVHWEDHFSSLPPLQPSHLGGGCKPIDVKYIVSLIVTPAGPGSDLDLPVEITIGTVPLRKVDNGTVMLTVKAAASRSDIGPVVKPKPSPKIQRAAMPT